MTAGTNFWQGRRVRLRGREPTDADHFIRWDLDSEHARHLDFVWPPVSKTFVRAWVEEQSKKRLENDVYQWMMESAAGEAVGSIVTHHLTRPQSGCTKSSGFVWRAPCAAWFTPRVSIPICYGLE